MDLYKPTQIPLVDLNEEIEISSLPVQGSFPSWLEGSLIRNGPAKFHFGKQMISHWFDGLAMLHAFSFSNGKIAYRNKFLRSSIYSQTMDQHNLHFMGFAEDPCWSIFKRLFTFFLPSLAPQPIQNANVNVTRIAKQVVALTETPLPVAFDLHTLDTIGSLHYEDDLRKLMCFESAHPHHDPIRKEIINYQTDFGIGSTYKIYTVPDEGPAERHLLFKMHTERASYMHTFALTPRFVILVEYPLLLRPIDLLLKGGGFISQFEWLPERKTRISVIDRDRKTLVKSYQAEPFFCFHHVNAYEEGEKIHLDLISYPNPEIVYGSPPPQQIRKLERFTLDLSSSQLSTKTIAETLLELPRIHYQKVNGYPYHYVYGVGFHYPETPLDHIPILKIDVETGKTQQWHEPGCLAGEAVFVADPHGTKEDEGVLLSVVIHPAKKLCFLLALDAQNLKEIARAEVPHLIPYGLHGMFFHEPSSI